MSQGPAVLFPFIGGEPLGSGVRLRLGEDHSQIDDTVVPVRIVG